jgi:oxygen-independent coproporphyrinogen-3 oxidase
VTAGVYVHVPFCLTRCGYCDFNAYAGLDHLASPYVSALLREAELAAPGWSGEEIASVFLGGGTPTTLEVADLKALLARLRQGYAVAPNAEVTIEANPDTVDLPKLEGLLEAGFARLSMGAQSFDPRVLARASASTTRGVRQAFAAASGQVRSRPRPDHGADGETLESWEHAAETSPARARQRLRAHDRKALGRLAGRQPAPDPDTQADMFQLACSMLRDAGYGHYEVSNWARPGYECRHNLGYWRRQPYLGLGAGAHSYRDDRRWWNPPARYSRRSSEVSCPSGAKRRSIRATPTSRRCSCVCASSRACRRAGSTTNERSRSSRAACCSRTTARSCPPSGGCCS